MLGLSNPRVYLGVRSFTRGFQTTRTCLLFQNGKNGVKLTQKPNGTPNRPSATSNIPETIPKTPGTTPRITLEGKPGTTPGAPEGAPDSAIGSTYNSSGSATTTTSSGPPNRIIKAIPKFLHPYTTRFVNAPFSHVTAFLILHELTAIVPLVSIWYVLHKYHISIPLDLPSWAIDKGTKIIDSSLASFDFSGFTINDKFNFIMEGAYSYVIVKFLLPVRLIFSLSLMPWFAKTFVIPFTTIFKKKKPEKENLKLKKVDKPRL